VANVSIHNIAKPGTLHSDQRSLMADPPDHTRPPPSRLSPPSENIPTDVEGIKIIRKEKKTG